MTPFDDFDDPVLTVAQKALQGRDGQDVLGELGWADLLRDFDSDLDARRAAFTFFRAQGRELSVSDALGRLMAFPYSAVLSDVSPHVMAVERHSTGRGDRVMIVGPSPSGHILVDRPGSGVTILEADSAILRPVDLPGSPGLWDIETDISRLPVRIPETEALALRGRRLQLGRIAVAYEILGTAEKALSVAMQHAIDREQFGRPIAGFQAVRHLLAAARVECAAIEALANQAIDAYPDNPSLHDAIVKAVAGRNGRKACERSLQVLGAMGFTAEHSHHRHHSRVLILDSLLGSSASLSHELAITLRASEGSIPDLSFPFAGVGAG